MVMRGASKGEADYRIIVALLVAVVIGLFIIWMFSQQSTSACPEEAFECDSSPCGCCVLDAFGNTVDYCDYNVCGQGYVLNPQGQCCSVDNPQECLSTQQVCINPSDCGDNAPCCSGYACVEGECQPCDAGMLCDPEDVNSCCSNFACNAQGRCESLLSCSEKPCANPGEKCSVCDSSGNCTDCTDNSYCAADPRTGNNVCKLQGECPAGYVQCNWCDNGCCDANTGECLSCSGMQCSEQQIGLPCSVCDDSGVCAECGDSVCANILGTYTCTDQGMCPEGYYSCTGCESGCCQVETGDCASCQGISCSQEDVGQQCSVCDNSGNCFECSDSVCAKSSSDSDVYSCASVGDCPLGYVEDPACPYECRDASTGTCAGDNGEGSIVIGGVEYLCLLLPSQSNESGMISSISCTTADSEGDNEWTTFTEDEFEEWQENPDVPSSVIQTEPPQICIDNYYECNYDGAIYDLNGDGLLNAADLQLFDQYCGSNLGSAEGYEMCSSKYDRRFDFNGDGRMDVLDRQCMRDVCEDGTCKVVDVSNTSLCYNSALLTAEQKYLLGTQLYNNASMEYNIGALGLPYSEDFANAFIVLDNYLKEVTLPQGLETSVSGTNMLVMRGSPYIKSPQVYYSGCAYMQWLEAGTNAGETNIYSRKLFILEREPDCSSRLNPTVTAVLYNGIRFAQQNFSETCMLDDCIGNMEEYLSQCFSASHYLCRSLTDTDDWLDCIYTFVGTEDRIPWLEGKYWSWCDKYSQLLVPECEESVCTQAYETCSGDASITSSCNSLKQQAYDMCVNQFTQSLLNKYSSVPDDMDDMITQQCTQVSTNIYDDCISSRSDCITYANSFGNTALNLMLLDAVSLLDMDSSASSQLDPVTMDSIPVAQITTTTCSYYENSKP